MRLIKWKKAIWILILFHVSMVIQGQIQIVFNASMHGKDLKGISFVQIISSVPQVINASLEVVGRNLTGDGQFLKMTVPSILVKPGSNMLPASSLSSSRILYSNSPDGNYLRQSGLMPEGELEFCFRIVVSSKNGPDEIFENCFETTNILSTPLELVSPVDEDIFCEKRPTFSWQPPLPLTPGMTYHFKLVEVGDEQSVSEAIMVNVPIIYQTNLRGFRLAFPSAVPDLKEGSLYAWQVTAADQYRKAVSEVWHFSIECEQKEVREGSYRVLKTMDDGGFLSSGSILRFAIDNMYTNRALDYAIYDLSDPGRPLKDVPEIKLQTGSNQIDIDLDRIPGMKEDKEYKLTVVMPGGKTVSLRFIYKVD